MSMLIAPTTGVAAVATPPPPGAASPARCSMARHIESLRAIFAKVCRSFEAQLIEMDGEHDHIHLLVEYPPNLRIPTW